MKTMFKQVKEAIAKNLVMAGYAIIVTNMIFEAYVFASLLNTGEEIPVYPGVFIAIGLLIVAKDKEKLCYNLAIGGFRILFTAVALLYALTAFPYAAVNRKGGSIFLLFATIVVFNLLSFSKWVLKVALPLFGGKLLTLLRSFNEKVFPSELENETKKASDKVKLITGIITAISVVIAKFLIK